MNQPVTHFIADLKSAAAEDKSAKREALQQGLDATQPLSLVRLAQLCALGDRMAYTSARRKAAQMALRDALAHARLFLAR